MTLTIHRYERLASTQDQARHLLEAGEADVGHVVVADRQTAGRGRFGRSWISPSGGLYATFIIENVALPSIHAGVALHDALASLGLRSTLKWPNDVLVSEKKLAGILIEEANGRLLVGVGVNLTEAPLPTATSAAACGTSIDPSALAGAMAVALKERAPSSILDAYRRRCATIGRHVRIERPGGGPPIEGQVLDVDDAGRLVLRADDGQVSCVSTGECLHVDAPARPVD